MSRSTSRLEARISPDLHLMLKRAAEIEGRTVTDFVSEAVMHAAQKVIERSEIIRLTLEDQEKFAEALLTPIEPNAALSRAFERRKKLLESK